MGATDILGEIERSLADSANGDRQTIRPAMRGFARLAELVYRGEVRWDDLRSWAASHIDAVVAARKAIAAWSAWMWDTFEGGGEEGAERALDWRSELEFAREVFRGTPAEKTLAAMSDEECDQEFHDEAERIGLRPDRYIPRAHFWWWFPPGREA